MDNTNITIDSFDLDQEYLKTFNFIMENSAHLPIPLIKFAVWILKRKDAVEQIDKIVNCLPVSENIEAGIFEFSLNYVKSQNLEYSDILNVYNDKVHDITINLDPNNQRIKNKTLLRNIIENKISANIVAFLKMYQIHPTRWKTLLDKNNLRDDTLSSVNTTDEYKCARCGERKHIYHISQTRSSDEPATVFYTCTVCKKTFTKSL